MRKHLLHHLFRDLLSLHGYPLPFESVERAAGQAEARDYAQGYGSRSHGSRGYGNRAASVRAGHAAAQSRAAIPPRACATGGCA